MDKKLCIITGADGGMGAEETRALALAGYHVIMACYCPSKAIHVRDRLLAEIRAAAPDIEVLDIEVLGIDLANLSSVRAFADTIKARFSRVDLLMNNAGTMETGRHLTVDGLERTVSVNYVGPYLLTRLLLPLMGAGSRIVNMASCVYCVGHLDFPDFIERGRKGAASGASPSIATPSWPSPSSPSTLPSACATAASWSTPPTPASSLQRLSACRCFSTR